MAISDNDRQAIEAAFDAAQRRTSAPLIGVMAEASSDYALAPLLGSFLVALATPWPLLLFTAVSAQRIFAVQLLVVLVALALFSFPRLRVALTPMPVRKNLAHRAALVQFVARGGERAAGRNTVLIYVSLAERYARVIAGEAAATKISAAEWQRLIDALTQKIAAEGEKQALTEAAERAADLLAPHFPGESGDVPRLTHFHLM